MYKVKFSRCSSVPVTIIIIIPLKALWSLETGHAMQDSNLITSTEVYRVLLTLSNFGLMDRLYSCSIRNCCDVLGCVFGWDHDVSV